MNRIKQIQSIRKEDKLFAEMKYIDSEHEIDDQVLVQESVNKIKIPDIRDINKSIFGNQNWDKQKSDSVIDIPFVKS